MCKRKRNNNANVYNDAHAFDGASAYVTHHAYANANYYAYANASYSAYANAIYAIDNYSFYVLDFLKNILYDMHIKKKVQIFLLCIYIHYIN